MQNNRDTISEKHVEQDVLPLGFFRHFLGSLVIVLSFLRARIVAIFLCLVISLGSFSQTFA